VTDPTFREDLINRLFRVPAKVSAGVLIVTIALGLIIGGMVGALLLGLAILALLGMLVLLWPDIPPAERMMRLAIALVVAAVAVVRIVPPGGSPNL